MKKAEFIFWAILMVANTKIALDGLDRSDWIKGGVFFAYAVWSAYWLYDNIRLLIHAQDKSQPKENQ